MVCIKKHSAFGRGCQHALHESHLFDESHVAYRNLSMVFFAFVIPLQLATETAGKEEEEAFSGECNLEAARIAGSKKKSR